MARISYDGLNNAPAQEVADASFMVLSTIQTLPQHIQCAATAAVFLMLCEHFRVPAQDVFVATKNILMDEREGQSLSFNTCRLYIQHEIAK